MNELYEKEQIKKILMYIKNNYNIDAEEKENFLYQYNIYIRDKKYDINIGLQKVQEDCFLFGKYSYGLSFDYEANKKYKNELNWHGGGFMDGYNENDFTNIDNFLNEWFEKKKDEQTTIFDFI